MLEKRSDTILTQLLLPQSARPTLILMGLPEQRAPIVGFASGLDA
jgi:hypothetical protein